MSWDLARTMMPALREVVARVVPGGSLVEVLPLGADSGAGGSTAKAAGYGEPLRLRVLGADGRETCLVFHTATSDIFGHDRRADRAAELLLAYDTFDSVPGNVRALDVGAVRRDGQGLVSVAEADEFYLVTTWADGRLYADDLRALATLPELAPRSLRCCERLAAHLVELHRPHAEDAARYRRSVRDLVGSGEGIFGIIDAYPEGTAAAPADRLAQIERSCVEWRWRSKGRGERLRRIHGDFHPFNVVLDERDRISLLDAARGCWGDPADDVAAMAINYVFFAVANPGTWRGRYGELWRSFWDHYLEGSGDEALLEVVAPYLAWRGLVVACPHWYPELPEGARDRLLTFVESALASPRFDPASAEDVCT